jgi:hypothetical protein
MKQFNASRRWLPSALAAVFGIRHANSQGADFEESTAQSASSPAPQDLKFDLMRTVPMSSFLQPKYEVHPSSVVAGSAGAAGRSHAKGRCTLAPRQLGTWVSRFSAPSG